MGIYRAIDSAGATIDFLLSARVKVDLCFVWSHKKGTR